MAKVLIGVTGGIAAYKAPGVIRRLREGARDQGDSHRCGFPLYPRRNSSIATGEASTPRRPDGRSGPGEHVSLARWADLFLVAPATADTMARAAIGLGDDLLSATILAGARRVLWAPAMNPEMWSSPVTERNVET